MIESTTREEQNTNIQNIVHVSYEPTDFFYYKSNLTPSELDCKTVMLFPCNENADDWNDMSFNCYRKELCNNRNLAKGVLESQTTTLETGERQHNIESIHEREKIQTLNLFGGILAMIAIIIWK